MYVYRALAHGRTELKYQKINVCETQSHHESNPPHNFENVAKWLDNNDGHRMLRFYRKGGVPGGPWEPLPMGHKNAQKFEWTQAN